MEQRFRDPAPGSGQGADQPPVPAESVPAGQMSAGQPGGYDGRAMYGPPTMSCSCGYQGHPLYAHPGYNWWLLPLWIPLGITVLGIVPLLLWGNRTRAECPSCGGDSFQRWGGEPTAEADRIYYDAKEADRKAFSRNKLVLLGVAVGCIGALLLLLFVLDVFGP